MVEILEIIAFIFIISVIIYTVKNYETLQKKVKENYLYQGLLYGLALIATIVILAVSCMLFLNALNNFGITGIEEILNKLE